MQQVGLSLHILSLRTFYYLELLLILPAAVSAQSDMVIPRYAPKTGHTSMHDLQGRHALDILDIC
jgi:hypothetical protein